MPLPSRIGLLGDIHAEHEALDVALRALADAGADTILAVGDIADGPGSVDRCCALLTAADALVVGGNHERWLLAGTMRELPEATLSLGAEARAFLAGLPRVRRFEMAGFELLLCHGLGDDDMESVNPDDPWSLDCNAPLTALLADDRPRLVLNGHTHRRLVWGHRNLALVNAGTLYRHHDPCFALVDLAGREVTYYELSGGARVTRTAARRVPALPG